MKWDDALYGRLRVYYIACGDFVKVGFTDNVKRRLCTVIVNNPIRAELLYDEPGDRALEAYRHWQLEHAHHRGEWFRREPVEVFLEQLKNGTEHTAFEGADPKAQVVDFKRRGILEV